MTPARNRRRPCAAVTSKPSARMRRGLSRIACRARPKGEREHVEHGGIGRPPRPPGRDSRTAPASRQSTPQNTGGGDAGEAAMAVEQRVVLLGEVEEGDGDRQRDHDRVDARGARPRSSRSAPRRSAATSVANGTSTHHGQPKPCTPELLRPKIAIDVAGDAGDADLRQADHAAIAGEQHQRQRDACRGSANRRRPGSMKKSDADDRDRRSAAPASTMWPTPMASQRSAGEVRAVPLAVIALIAAFPMMPCGRKASTTTMMTKVSTTP